MQPDTAAYNAALDAFREDSADAAQVRDDAREDVQAAERVRDQLFPTFGRTAATAAPPPQAPQPQQALGSTIGGRPTLSLSREERVQYAEREYDALVAAGIARSVAGRSVAAKYGIQIIDQP